MLILKEVESACFVILLQVFILKGVREESSTVKSKDNAETQRALSGRGNEERLALVEGLIRHPPVFCKKRRQAIENKGREREKERQEKTRGGKLLGTWELRRGRGSRHERGWENDGKARRERQEESIEKVGEGIVVGVGLAAGGRLSCLLSLSGGFGSPGSGEQVCRRSAESQRLPSFMN